MPPVSSFKANFLLFWLLLGGLLPSFLANATESKKENNLTNNLTSIIDSSEFQKNIKRIHKINQTPTSIEANELLEADNVLQEGIPEGEEILLSLYIDKYYLADIFAYKTQENAQLSLIDLFELLDFPIEVNGNNASGWFINEQNSFSLDLPDQDGDVATVSINGKRTVLTAESYYLVDKDIFVDANIVSQWFDFTFKFNFLDLNVMLFSKNPLPLQLKLAREQKQVASYETPESVLPWTGSPYQSFSTPLVDVQLKTTVYKDRDSAQSYSVLSSQDFAYLNSELYVSGNNDDVLNNIRLTFEKNNTNGELLGPLNATNYQFGDIYPVKTASSSTGNLGRGVRFSNENSNAVDNRTKTFSGNIQPEWDIELYRNGLLLEKDISSDEGRYEFKDVPLLFGKNEFILVFYGPQGQIKKKTEQIYIDKEAVAAQSGQYAFSVVDTSKQLFELDDVSSTDQAGWLSTISYKQGLSDSISLHSGVELLATDEGDNTQTYSLGADISLFSNLLIGADFEVDGDKHKQTSFQARTQVVAQSLSFSLSSNDNFDWETPEIVTKSESYSFAMSGSLYKGNSVGLNYSNSLSHNKNSDLGTVSYAASNTLGLSTPFVYVNNSLDWDKSNTDNTHFLDGSIAFKKQLGTVYTSLDASYSVKPEQSIDNVNYYLSFPIIDDIYSSFNFNYQPLDDSYQSELSTSFQLDKFNLQGSVQYDSDDDWQLSLSTYFSLGYEPLSKEIFISSQKLTQHGAVVARVFADENLNGIFDENEVLIEGVKVKAVQHQRQANTNEQGVAILKALSENKKTDIIIDRNSIEDPFIIPATPGVSITPRKGFVEVIDIPLVNAGELDGTVYLRDRKGNKTEGAYLVINLTNDKNEVVKTTETEFDGYYLFTDLLPGKYSVSIAESDIAKKNLHDSKALAFEFSGAGDVIAGADFMVDRYTFVKGYVVSLGEFNSLPFMKAYWLIIKGTYDNALQQQVFYSENEELQSFQLNGGFFNSNAHAQRACNYLKEKQLNCSVEKFELNI